MTRHAVRGSRRPVVREVNTTRKLVGCSLPGQIRFVTGNTRGDVRTFYGGMFLGHQRRWIFMAGFASTWRAVFYLDLLRCGQDRAAWNPQMEKYGRNEKQGNDKGNPPISFHIHALFNSGWRPVIEDMRGAAE